MGNNGTSSLATLVLFATMNTTAICITFDQSMLPTCNAEYIHSTEISNWREQYLKEYTSSIHNSNDINKIEMIIEFSKKVIENSNDIDSEFVEIVNNKFWDLI